MRHYRLSFFAVLVFLFFGFMVHAQPIEPKALASSVIRTTDKDDFIFSFKIQLPAQPADRYTISYMSSGITNERGSVLPINQVKLITNGDFAEATYFDITLTDIKEPGEYKGKILLKVLQKTKTKEFLIPVALKVVNGIEVEKMADPLPVTMTNRVGFFPVKDGQLVTRYKIKSDRVVATVASLGMSLRGRTSGDIVTNKDAIPISGDTLKDELTIYISNRDLPADTYNGWVNVNINGLQGPVRFDNVVVKIKHGWLWVVITIIVGLFLGRWITLYNSPEIQNYYKFMDRIWDLKERAIHLGMKQPVLEKLIPVERKLRQDVFDAVEVDAALDEIEKYIIEFEVAIEKQEELIEIPDDVKSQIGGATGEIDWRKKNDRDFSAAVAEHQKSLSRKAGLRAENDNPLNRFLLNFTGLRMRSFARSPRFRTIMFVVTVLLVAGLGFTLHYLNKPDFGEQGFFDYFNVLLWSSGSTAVLKSLFSV
jgi:hypothetical protein